MWSAEGIKKINEDKLKNKNNGKRLTRARMCNANNGYVRKISKYPKEKKNKNV